MSDVHCTRENEQRTLRANAEANVVLPHSRHVFNQQMPARNQAGQRQAQYFTLAADHLAQAAFQIAQPGVDSGVIHLERQRREMSQGRAETGGVDNQSRPDRSASDEANDLGFERFDLRECSHVPALNQLARAASLHLHISGRRLLPAASEFQSLQPREDAEQAPPGRFLPQKIRFVPCWRETRLWWSPEMQTQA